MPSRATETARQFVQYHQRVLETGPIAYWLLDEKQGNVAYDRVAENGAQNGAHVGVTLYQPGIGDGRTSPFYDGTNDYTNIFTATLSAAFSGPEGSAAMWARVAGAGVWTDGAVRATLILFADLNNNVWLRKENVNNRFRMLYEAGGVTEQVIINGITSVDWIHFALTWSASAGASGEVRGYMDGVQQGATQVTLGVWCAPPCALVNQCLIGATHWFGPTDPWHGYLAHCAVWDRPLPPNEVLYLYESGASH